MKKHKKKTCVSFWKRYPLAHRKRHPQRFPLPKPDRRPRNHCSRQATSNSPICKRGRSKSPPSPPKVRQSGSPVVAGTKKDETVVVVAEANNSHARAAECPSYPQNPMPLGQGEVQIGKTCTQNGLGSPFESIAPHTGGWLHR